MAKANLENLTIEELVSLLEETFYKVKENLTIEDFELLTHDQHYLLVELGIANLLDNLHFELAVDVEDDKKDVGIK